MSSEFRMRMKKNAIGPTSVTLDADAGGLGEQRPPLTITTVVINTVGTPPVEFFGAAAGDGRKYELILRPTT